MLTVVYKSPKKQFMYLFVEQRDDFSKVPEGLMATFGTPQLVTIVNLATKDKLAFADLAIVKQRLTENGFYLQLPPPIEDLLADHKKQQKLNTDN
ncbi:MAG: YcgL domain-containing protein [Thalassotalea sp.]